MGPPIVKHGGPSRPAEKLYRPGRLYKGEDLIRDSGCTAIERVAWHLVDDSPSNNRPLHLPTPSASAQAQAAGAGTLGIRVPIRRPMPSYPRNCFRCGVMTPEPGFGFNRMKASGVNVRKCLETDLSCK